MKEKRAFLQGLPVDLMTEPEIWHCLGEWFKNPSQARQLITLNANMFMLALRNEQLYQAVRDAALVLPDGFGIVRALMRRNYRVRRVTGLDLTRILLRIAAQQGYSVYFYGGRRRVAGQLTMLLPQLFPGLLIQKAQDGYGCQQAVAAELRARPPRLLLVGLGTPAQELFLKKNLPDLQGTVGVGVGGVFEVLAGLQNQAPRFLRDHGLEWLFRMIQEPRRFNRLPDLVRFWWQFIRGGELDEG